MNALHLAVDVVREAVARRFMLGVFAFIGIGLLVLAFALDLEVVEGTLAASRLFGEEVEHAIVPVDVAMNGIFQALAYAVFYLGVIFGVVATTGTAANLLAPGRVELLLSLPVRRVEVVLGTYLGVQIVSLISTVVAVVGLWIILGVKTRFFTPAPFAGALAATIGFLAIYAFMLLATTLVRSAAMAAASGLVLLVGGAITSDRATFIALFEPGWIRDAIGVVITPLPKLHALAESGAEAAVAGQLWIPGTGPLILSTIAFAGACVAAAAFVLAIKDY